MAKILKVKLESIPEVINVGDDISDITVITSIEFHRLDITLEMEYMLILFVYDINGDIDIPVIIGNWDKTEIYGVTSDRKDKLLGKVTVPIICKNKNEEIVTSIALKLGKLSRNDSHFSRTLEVFATLIPAIGRSSNWSDSFESNLIF
jgi:hypothetical protein